MLVRLIVIVAGSGLMVFFFVSRGLWLLAIPMSVLAAWAALMTAELALSAGCIVLHLESRELEAAHFLKKPKRINLQDVHAISLEKSPSRVATALEVSGERKKFVVVARFTSDLAAWARAVANEGRRQGIDIALDVERPDWEAYNTGYPGTYTFVDTRLVE